MYIRWGIRLPSLVYNPCKAEGQFSGDTQAQCTQCFSRRHVTPVVLDIGGCNLHFLLQGKSKEVFVLSENSLHQLLVYAVILNCGTHQHLMVYSEGVLKDCSNITLALPSQRQQQLARCLALTCEEAVLNACFSNLLRNLNLVQRQVDDGDPGHIRSNMRFCRRLQEERFAL